MRTESVTGSHRQTEPMESTTTSFIPYVAGMSGEAIETAAPAVMFVKRRYLRGAPSASTGSGFASRFAPWTLPPVMQSD